MQKYSDAELVALYIESKGPEFLTELFTRHSDIVYRTALRIMKNPSDAEDILQTVYCKLITSLHLYKGTGSVIGWMLQVVINTCYNQLQSDKSRHNRDKKIMAERAQTTSPKNNELKEMIENHLNKLPEIYKAPIILQIMEGLSIKEVSEALEIPEKTIRSQIARGLEKLKVSLQSVGVTASIISIGEMVGEIHKPLAPAAIKTSQYFNSIIQNKSAVSAKLAVSSSAKGLALSKIVAVSILVAISVSAIFVLNRTPKITTINDERQMRTQKIEFENTKDIAAYNGLGLSKGGISLIDSGGVNDSRALSVDENTTIELDISQYKLPIRISYVTDFFASKKDIDYGQLLLKSNYLKNQKINLLTGLRESVDPKNFKNSPNAKNGYLGKWLEHVIYIDENCVDFWVEGKRTHFLKGVSVDDKKVGLNIAGKVILDNLVIESVTKDVLPDKSDCEKIVKSAIYQEGVFVYEVDKEKVGLNKNSKVKPYLQIAVPEEWEKQIGLDHPAIHSKLNQSNKIVWLKE